jgi:hypothetical protein
VARASTPNRKQARAPSPSRLSGPLGTLGYRHDVTVEPGLPIRLVLRHSNGRQIDLHPVIFDDEATAGSRSATTRGAAARGWIIGGAWRHNRGCATVSAIRRTTTAGTT